MSPRLSCGHACGAFFLMIDVGRSIPSLRYASLTQMVLGTGRKQAQQGTGSKPQQHFSMASSSSLHGPALASFDDVL